MRLYLFKNLINRFYPNDKYKFNFLFFMSLIAGVFEYIGLILIFQFVLFLSNPQSIYSKGINNFFITYLNISDYSKIALILGISISSIYILKNIYMFIFVKINNSILEDLSTKITLKTIRNILYQDYNLINSIDKSQKAGLISKVSIIVWQYCHRYINLAVNSVIIIILTLFLLVKFGLGALIAGSFTFFLAYFEYLHLKRKSKEQNLKYSQTTDEVNLNILNIINHTKEIKINNKEEYFINKSSNSFKKIANLNKERSFYDVFHIYFTEITIMIAFAIILILLFYMTKFDNQLLITSISTICAIILRITPAINRAQSCLYLINSNEKIVLELLEFDRQFDCCEKISLTKEKLPFNKSIELKDVCFSYDNDKKGLKNINLIINKGDFIGIVGKSGCYKTTLSLILAGLIKPNKGKLLIDNQEADYKNQKKWQNNIALLSQNFMIFDDTKIDKKYIQKLDLNFINTEFENLSAGQKQRLALAEVLSRDKDILILDEITSSIDVLSEEKINNIMKELKGKKTIISIAHRLHILKYATKIVYMDKGKIIDVDTFENLANKYEDFKKIVELSSFNV